MAYSIARKNAQIATLLRRNARCHDRSDNAIHMIVVACEAVLAHAAAGVTALADILLYRAKVRRKIPRIALFVALQIRTIFRKFVACQAAVLAHNTEMRLMNKTRENPVLGVGRERRKIDDASAIAAIIDAVALRA